MSPITAETVGDVVNVRNAEGAGPLLVVCEHASPRIPEMLDDLGIADEVKRSHVVWDPGALVLAERIAEVFDSPLVAAQVSRLVYDLNRPPEHPGATPAKSEVFDIPGNRDLPEAERAARVDLIYNRFHDEVARQLDARVARGLPTVLVTIHTFTPIYFGEPREVEIGVLHDVDERVANSMLDAASAIAPRIVERNEPYGPEDGVTHTLKLHGLSRSIPNVMIEVRNDLVKSDADCATIAQELIGLLTPALDALGLPETGDAQHV